MFIGVETELYGHSTLVPVVPCIPALKKHGVNRSIGGSMGQSEAIFISFRGFWNEDEVGSGLKDWITSFGLS